MQSTGPAPHRHQHISALWKLIMHVECGCAILAKHSTFSMMQCRKYNFVLIDVKVEVLSTLFAGTFVSKVYICFSMFTRKKFAFLKCLFKLSDTKVVGMDSLVICITFHRIHVNKHSIQWETAIFQWKWHHVNVAPVYTNTLAYGTHTSTKITSGTFELVWYHTLNVNSVPPAL